MSCTLGYSDEQYFGKMKTAKNGATLFFEVKYHTRCLIMKWSCVEFCWVSSHCGILHNELKLIGQQNKDLWTCTIQFIFLFLYLKKRFAGWLKKKLYLVLITSSSQIAIACFWTNEFAVQDDRDFTLGKQNTPQILNVYNENIIYRHHYFC